jgi:uncharacterized protein
MRSWQPILTPRISQMLGEWATMSARHRTMNLDNETIINVAALLKEPVGAAREYPLHLDRFSVDEDLLAEDVEGTVKLTRLADEIIANITARGTVDLECVRCLRTYAQPFSTRFAAEFRPTVDVRTGFPIADESDGDERFSIDANHELDIGEVLRQEIVVALPMRAICGPDCPGPELERLDMSAAGDDRFAALAQLLEQESDEI